MPRLLRLDVPDVSQHVIQRGNDRKSCFFSDEDYAHYLNDLREIAMRERCAAHGYVLMTNHVHLLITPSAVGATGRCRYCRGRLRAVGQSCRGLHAHHCNALIDGQCSKSKTMRDIDQAHQQSQAAYLTRGSRKQALTRSGSLPMTCLRSAIMRAQGVQYRGEFQQPVGAFASCRGCLRSQVSAERRTSSASRIGSRATATAAVGYPPGT